jgi:hypothetical protein
MQVEMERRVFLLPAALSTTRLLPLPSPRSLPTRQRAPSTRNQGNSCRE